MSTLLETRRRRLVQIKLDAMKHRTGGYFQIVKLEDGSALPVELDRDILTRALMKYFEEMIFDNHKREEAGRIISGHYSNCAGLHKLTPHGVEFMDAIIETLAEESMKSQEGFLDEK